MKKPFKHTFLGYFLFYYRILKFDLIFNLLLSVATSFLDGVGLAIFIPLLQGLDSSGQAKHGAAPPNKFAKVFEFLHLPFNLNTILLALVLVFVVKGALKFWQLNSQVQLRQTFMSKVRYELIDNLHYLSFDGFLQMDAGKINNVLNVEVNKLQSAIVSYLTSISGIAMLLTYVAMAFAANWQFAILVTIGAMLSNLLFRKIFAKVKVSSVHVSERGNVFNSKLLQAVHYFKYLKATNYFRVFSIKIKQVIDDSEKLSKNIGLRQAITASMREPLVLLIVVIVIIIQVKWLGGNIGSTIFSLLLFYRALTALMVLQTSWQLFIQNVGAIDSVSKLTSEMADLHEVQSATPFTEIKNGIHLRNLSFFYSTNRILDNISIDIKKNETIAFVGESGSGKTTLANMIIGLLQPAEGQILIDEHPLADYNLDSYRSKIGYISQEVVIFNDDIYNNITFWAEPTPENKARFQEIISLTSLNSFLENLPDGEHTKLGDNGLTISGGQKQRISIARELFKQTQIIVFDEATSALDSETERIIQENIEKLHGSYTMIIIAHRLSTIKNVDTIYLLGKGKVEAFGDFNTVMEKSAKFKRMVALQEV